MTNYIAKCILALMVVTALNASPAFASITGYTSRSVFDAAVTSPSIENWDSYADNTTIANGSTLNGITYNSSTNISVVNDTFLPTTSPNSLGRTPIDFFQAGDSITFTFVTPINAFGIDINTFATAAGSFQAVTNLGDVALSGFDPFPGESTGQFVGFTSDQAISSVTIGAAAESYTLDTMRYSQVPEPATFFVWSLLGLTSTHLLRRRRNK